MLAAKRSIVTVEEIVHAPRPAPRRGGAAVVDGQLVAAVPGGSRPSYALGYYDRDNDYYLAWDPIARDRDVPAVAGHRHLGEPQASVTNSGECLCGYTSDEMMTVSAARALRDGVDLLRRDRAAQRGGEPGPRDARPGLVLIYESGTIGAKPDRLPLSIGDGILAETADAVVSVPEIFNYWLQPGRIDVGFLGAAQIDKFGNINTTVIGGDYAPRRRGCPAPAAPPKSPHPAVR